MPLPFSMYLRYTDGTKGVFCDNGLRRTRPCNGRLTYSADDKLISGYVLEIPGNGVHIGFCTLKCLESYARRQGI